MTRVLPPTDKPPGVRSDDEEGTYGTRGARANDARPGSGIVSLLVREGRYTSGPEVLSELRRAIASGEVPAGNPIRVDEVAAFFGVSRIPVREALKTLVGEGLVEQHWRRGFTVTALSPAELAELYLVRGALVGAASGVAAGNASRADHARAEAAHARFVESMGTWEAAGFHRSSREFHASLVAPSRMPHLLRMLDIAWNLTPPVRTRAWMTSQLREEVLVDHRAMLEAFVTADVERLIHVSEKHHERLARIGTRSECILSSPENRDQPQ